jgi:hypothetical protein
MKVLIDDCQTQLTALHKLELRGLLAMPQGLTALTGFEDLLLEDCWGMKEITG